MSFIRSLTSNVYSLAFKPALSIKSFSNLPPPDYEELLKISSAFAECTKNLEQLNKDFNSLSERLNQLTSPPSSRIILWKENGNTYITTGSDTTLVADTELKNIAQK